MAVATHLMRQETWQGSLTKPVISPKSNGIAENFVKTIYQDYAKLANRPDSKTVKARLNDWFDDYNSYHPHSALSYLPSTLFREKLLVIYTHHRFLFIGSRSVGYAKY